MPTLRSIGRQFHVDIKPYFLAGRTDQPSAASRTSQSRHSLNPNVNARINDPRTGATQAHDRQSPGFLTFTDDEDSTLSPPTMVVNPSQTFTMSALDPTTIRPMHANKSLAND